MEPDRYTKTLSQNLRSIRKNKGLTTVDLAKILGISQAKVSYIEHCKGVLSARDIAVLSRKLDVPITEFFRGLNEPEDASGAKDLALQLARYGAVLLAKPSGVTFESVPFEEVVARALGFIEDDRLHKGFCAALISQAAHREINVDRIFALIGDNPFLTDKIFQQANTCLEIVELLNLKRQKVVPRAKQQISKIAAVAKNLIGETRSTIPAKDELSDLAEFVGDCKGLRFSSF
jgi:transcriptional regulator with XRE-family HTH domain